VSSESHGLCGAVVRGQVSEEVGRVHQSQSNRAWSRGRASEADSCLFFFKGVGLRAHGESVHRNDLVGQARRAR